MPFEAKPKFSPVTQGKCPNSEAGRASLQPSSPRIDEDQISRNLPSKVRTVELKKRKRSRRRQKQELAKGKKAKPANLVLGTKYHTTLALHNHPAKVLFQPVRSPLSKPTSDRTDPHTFFSLCLRSSSYDGPVGSRPLESTNSASHSESTNTA